MPTRVIINGAQGKMGTMAVSAIQNQSDFELVACLSRDDNLRVAIEKNEAHIVIDLTRADCAWDNTLAIIESNAHPVIGTSGLTKEQLQILKEKCEQKQLGGIIAPNFSISAVLMMRFAAIAAHYLPDVEIIEAHHPQKFDAPSGTALKTAEMIAHSRRAPLEKSHHELIKGVRGGMHQDIAIHSLRLAGILARQDVIFGNSGETLSLIHNTIDRSSFMPGILLCCRKVQSLSTLYYGMEHILDD